MEHKDDVLMDSSSDQEYKQRLDMEVTIQNNIF